MSSTRNQMQSSSSCESYENLSGPFEATLGATSEDIPSAPDATTRVSDGQTVTVTYLDPSEEAVVRPEGPTQSQTCRGSTQSQTGEGPTEPTDSQNGGSTDSRKDEYVVPSSSSSWPIYPLVLF